MQHLNYCRQALKYFSENPPLIPCYVDFNNQKEKEKFYIYASSVISELQNAKKIQLPEFGRVLDDMTLRGLNPESAIHLPYPVIALEYSKPKTGDTETLMSCSKRITLAKEYGSHIAIMGVCYADTYKGWGVFHPVFLDKVSSFTVPKGGGPAKFNFSYTDSLLDPGHCDEVSCVLDFLNALACKNVHIEKSPAKATKQGKNVKAALPFDDYHFLTVDVPGKTGARGEGFGGSHRSPREHLRRGHIRRLESGPIWVNACVVNAGIGSKVGKSYLVRRAQ